MRFNTRFFFSFLVAGLAACHAQTPPSGFKVEVMPLLNFPHVVDEPVDVRVTIRNQTGQPLRTAAGDRFAFEVTRPNSREREVARYANAKLPEIELQPGAAWQGDVRLTEMFKMRSEGDYFIRASVANRTGKGESAGLMVTVSQGVTLKQAWQNFDNGKKREFRLVYLQNYQVGEYLYLRIIDPDGARAWDTLRLGAVFRLGEEPKLDIQNDGTVTVIHRANRDVHYKTTLVSSHAGVRITSHEALPDPDALAQKLMEPFILKAMEPPPKKKSWWKFW